jgi:hypothetical protein
MKTKTITIYSVSELSEQAKENAHSNWLDGFSYPWEADNRSVLDKFTDIFPVSRIQFEYGGGGQDYIGFNFTENEAIMELSGQRLATYIWNNYRNRLFKGKYHSVNSNVPVHHNRVTYTTLRNGNTHNAYGSAIFLDNCCPLTGYCIDDNMLKPIYDFLDKPDDTTFLELMDKCLHAWLKACSDDYEGCQSMEYFIDECEANDYEFAEDGERM